MKEKTKKLNKEAFITKISRYTDLSLKSSKGFRIEITSDKNGYKTITVYDVKKIDKYTNNCIVLNTENENLLFSGEDLECLTYASGAMEIRGKTKIFEFIEAEEKENV